MKTTYRIGYPYASHKQCGRKDSVVILIPVSSPGFREVISKGQRYFIPENSKGPSILDGHKRGVQGQLIESNDNKISISDPGSRKIRGQGNSMQLALVLH